MDPESDSVIDLKSASRKGTRKIIEKILADANFEAQSILSYAEKQVQDILNSAINESNAAKQEMLKKGKQEAITEKNRILSQARLDMRKNILVAKEEQINKVLDKTKKILSDPDRIPDFKQVIKALTMEACLFMGGGKLLVKTNAKGVEVLKGTQADLEKDITKKTGVATKLSLADEGIDGVVVESSHGVVVDNTFLTRLERRKREIRKDLSEILFR
ncbi:MAG: V-type ATP synthase subunit E [Candidatus Methanofastidiosia archaeon]